MKKILLSLIMMLNTLSIMASMEAKPITVEEALANGRVVTLCVRGQYLYGNNAQNCAMGTPAVAVATSNVVIGFRVEKATNGYLFRAVTPSGGDYGLWGANPCYLNAQPSATGVTFILGKNQDIADGSTWTFEADGSLKNVGNGAYFNGANTSETPIAVSLVEIVESADEPSQDQDPHSSFYTLSKDDYKYANSASVEIYDGAIPLDAISAYELGVFNKNGECVGVKANLSSSKCVVNVHSNNASGDVLVFRLYNKYSGKEISLSSNNGNIVFDAEGEYFIGTLDVPDTLYVPQLESGIDMSDRIVNHGFSDIHGKGWQYPNNLTSIHGGFEEFPCAEAYEMPFEVYQDIDNLENGLYKVTINSFYRPSSNGTYNGTENVPVQLMLDDFYTPVQHILSDPLPVVEAVDQFNCYLTYSYNNADNIFNRTSGSDILDYNSPLGYVPNGMTGASVAFLSGRYKQTVYGLVEDGNLRLGLTSMGKNAHWCLWSNFRLYYMEKDSTALDAVIRNYIGRAEVMIDTINCSNNNFVKRFLQTGINRAQSSLGQNENEMYNALIYLNGCIKNYLENLESFVLKSQELQTQYDAAKDILDKEHYSGYDDFKELLSNIKDYIDDGLISLDQQYSDIEYVDIAIAQLSAGISTYRASANSPFPEELALLKETVPAVKSYQVSKSHITSIDISNCGLTTLPLELLSLPNLESINSSYNNISDISIPDEYVTLLKDKHINLQYQEIDKVIDIDCDKLVNFDSAITQMPSLPYYDFKSNSYMAHGVGINISVQKPSQIGYNDWAINIDYSSEQPVFSLISNGNNAYYGNSGDTLYVSYPFASNEVYGSYYRSRFFFNQGDVNFANGIDATDLQATILYAFGDYRTYPFNFTAADTYKDGSINVQDVICTVNILLEASDAITLETRNRHSDTGRKMAKSSTDTEAYMYVNNGKVFLHSQVPVASLSIKTDGNVKWDLGSVGLMQSAANGNVVAYSLNGATIPSNEDVVLGEWSSNATLYSVSLSDADAQPISVSFMGDSATNITDASEAADERMKIYDISGFSKNSLGNGINIIRSNSAIKKIYKK